jgi:formate dehydrogenase subunit gamma
MSAYLKHMSRGLLAALAITLMSLGIPGDAPIYGVSQAHAQEKGAVPGNASGIRSDADLWRAIGKQEIVGQVSIPDKKAGRLVQRDGEAWRNFTNGPLKTYGAYALGGILVLLVLFFLLRGRIKIDHGPDAQGRTILRFNALERAVHWLTASSFIVLALTGLNLMYGRYFLPKIIGDQAFGTLTYYGKLGHNYIAFTFMVGIVLMFVLWVGHNIPKARDLKWLAVGGGLFSKGLHPEAGRFNAGQKLIFWSVILGGFSLSLSGVALMWPFEVTPWAGTFAFLNNFGLDLPTVISPLQEVQLSVLWHSIVALIMIVIVIAHIYIGSVGMEGAFDAVGDGEVDLNWAKEHHSLWVEEEMQKTGAQEPAE